MGDGEHEYTISYGKAQVPLYRVYARPLAGLAPIPESAFTGRDNTLFAVEVDVEVFGTGFLSAYTAGDNSRVVATDSMKNVILHQALAYDGATLEGFLDHLGRYFLATYPHLESLRVSAREMPFTAARVPLDAAGAFGPSNVLFARTEGDHTVASLDLARAGDSTVLTAHRCGRVGLQLLKVTGSSFTRFVRDANTTLPERGNRPLYISLDIYWTYAEAADSLGADLARYVAAEQVRDVALAVFHQFISESIQHLVHEIGQRLLERFPRLASASFEAENHTPDPIAVSDADPKVKVYSSPFPAFGLIKLTISRSGGSGHKQQE
jgi:urate oxidase / 2-oxo-4-hydroxy-4-carboxy-5-ureidoimidazoline decarboxylase